MSQAAYWNWRMNQPRESFKSEEDSLESYRAILQDRLERHKADMLMLTRRVAWVERSLKRVKDPGGYGDRR